ncbi:hypothetical protein [Streptomyces parvus]|uniref:hypothetical protein n=1 Tax=Streptomyces parvus TaxID=66428 RepID=UPI0033F67374
MTTDHTSPARTAAEFARGFRLHLPHGQVLDGAELPGGRAFVMDDPMWGLGSTARTVDLLQAGYPDARIEWADQQPAPVANRAAVLDEAADAIESDSWSRRDRWGRYEREEFEAGLCAGAVLLRRLATPEEGDGG